MRPWLGRRGLRPLVRGRDGIRSHLASVEEDWHPFAINPFTCMNQDDLSMNQSATKSKSTVNQPSAV